MTAEFRASPTADALAKYLHRRGLLLQPSYIHPDNQQCALAIEMIRFIVAQEQNPLDKLRLKACALIALLGEISKLITENSCFDDQITQGSIARSLVIAAATRMDMQPGDYAHSLRLQLCPHLAEALEGMRLEDSINYRYSTALEMAIALFSCINDPEGEFHSLTAAK